MAQREGFEPPDSFLSTVFKTAAIDHSTISAKLFSYKNQRFDARQSLAIPSHSSLHDAPRYDRFDIPAQLFSYSVSYSILRCEHITNAFSIIPHSKGKVNKKSIAVEKFFQSVDLNLYSRLLYHFFRRNSRKFLPFSNFAPKNLLFFSLFVIINSTV